MFVIERENMDRRHKEQAACLTVWIGNRTAVTFVNVSFADDVMRIAAVWFMYISISVW